MSDVTMHMADLLALKQEIDHLRALACWQPDDGEAIDKEFVQSLGPSNKRTANVNEFECENTTVYISKFRGRNEWYASVTMQADIVSVHTRGDLRRLLKCLGWRKEST